MPGRLSDTRRMFVTLSKNVTKETSYLTKIDAKINALPRVGGRACIFYDRSPVYRCCASTSAGVSGADFGVTVGTCAWVADAGDCSSAW